MDNLSRAVEYSTASTGLRFANFIVDFIVYVIVWNFMQWFVFYGLYPIAETSVFPVGFPVFWYVFGALFCAMFYAVQEYLFKGRTIGKFITGTKAVTLDGEEPDFKKYF